MDTDLRTYTVAEVAKGFVYNEFEGKGLFGLDGDLIIQPEYQRNYIYNDGKRDGPLAVLEPSAKVATGLAWLTPIGSHINGSLSGDGRPTDENRSEAVLSG